jgi:hypothetical protein
MVAGASSISGFDFSGDMEQIIDTTSIVFAGQEVALDRQYVYFVVKKSNLPLNIYVTIRGDWYYN